MDIVYTLAIVYNFININNLNNLLDDIRLLSSLVEIIYIILYREEF